MSLGEAAFEGTDEHTADSAGICLHSTDTLCNLSFNGKDQENQNTSIYIYPNTRAYTHTYAHIFTCTHTYISVHMSFYKNNEQILTI